jgi:hypothetical protein
MTAVLERRPVATAGVMRLTAGRLLRLELRRNAMMFLVPLVIVMFWFDTYRSSMQLPAVWPTRLLYVQQGRPLVDFAPFVAGAAAWTGSRDGRRGTAEQVATTPLPRWAARLSGWAALALWALGGYVLCMGLLLGASAAQSPTGPLPWWPILVGALGVLAFSALGFTAGVVFPSRFAVPLVAIGVLLILVLTQYPITHNATYGLLAPTNLMGAAGPQGGIFSPYLPDLSIVQILFLAGLTVFALGLMGLGRRVGALATGLAVIVTVLGLAATGYGAQLAGTARVTGNGVVVSAVHSASDDTAAAAPQVCQGSPVQVCVSPVYRSYLPRLDAALQPLLTEVAGLPGAPTKVEQVEFPYHGDAVYTIASLQGSPAVLNLGLNIGADGSTCFVTGPKSSTCSSVTALWQNASLVKTVVLPHTAQTVLADMIGEGGDAQQAVVDAMLASAGVSLTDPTAQSQLPPGAPRVFNPEVQVLGPTPGSPVAVAAARFAALSAAERGTWLSTHLSALRAGHITAADLP